MSYSQNCEEEHIARIVGRQPGRFLEIGAYNPKLFSNTRALFEAGWSGVMVEASPGPFMDLLIEYGNCDRIKLVCAAVTVSSARSAFVKFYHSEAGVGTSNEAHYQKWRDKTAFDGTFYAASLDIHDLIFSEFGRDYDFVNIDVEGESADLFLKALQYDLFPKCYCVEHDGRQAELAAAALKYGYETRHVNGENIILEKTSGE